MLAFILRTLGILIASTLAIVCGWAFQQLSGMLDPSLHYIARNCIGAVVAVGVLFGVLLIFKTEREEN